MSLSKSIRTRVALFITGVMVLTLTACINEQDDHEMTGPGGYVQDLWIIDRIATLDANNEHLDLTEVVAAHFAAAEPSRSVELMDGVVFHEYAELNPSIIDTELDPRNSRQDVDMTAGFIETGAGRSLSLLATPDSETDNPIYFKDVLGFDLTFLGDIISPGDPLIYDYAFLQAIPRMDPKEEDLDPLELLRYRMDKKRIQFFGRTVGDEVIPMVYTNEIGMVMQGSLRAAAPAKSQDMLDGFEAGTRDCVKKFRGSALECVEEFMTTFIDGVSSSWKLIDEQIEFVETEVEERRRQYRKEVFEEERRKPAPKPGSEECGLPAAGGGGGGGDDSGGAAPSDGDDGGTTGGSGDCGTPGPNNGDKNNEGSTKGEPHVRTFDGNRYSMQGIGEYIAAQSEHLTVQIRTSKAMSRVSSVSAVAVGFDDHEVVIEAVGVTIDGRLEKEPYVAFDNAELFQNGHVTTIEFANGEVVRVVSTWKWAMDLEIWNPVAGEWSGLLGNFDGDPDNDFITRDGRVYEHEPTFEEMYQDFSESWRVTQEESLLPYEAGETTEAYTDRSFPQTAATVDTLPADYRRQAERMCLAAGIEHERVFDECVLDYALLSDLDDLTLPAQLWAIRTAVSSQQDEGLAGGPGTELNQRVEPPENLKAPKPGDKKDEPDSTTPGSGSGVGPTPDTGQAVEDTSWRVTANELLTDNALRKSLQCGPGGTPGPLWGGFGAYAMDSSVCTAAVHAGVITLSNGGLILVHRTYDPYADAPDFSQFDDFPGYTSFDGVTSLSRPAGPSFHFNEEEEGGFVIRNYGEDD